MIDVIDGWLRLAAARLHDEAAMLTALDQAIGDGDHGTNMERGFAAIVATLDAGHPEVEDDRAMAAARLRAAGRTLINTVGGAAGPLYGTGLIRAGEALGKGESVTTTSAILAALHSAIEGIQRLGNSTSGEKTMLDALIPALEAGQACAASTDTDAVTVLRAMADAADAGAASTLPMLATKGRASYLGERSIGHQDPGATSSALLLQALADVVAERVPTIAQLVLIGRSGAPGIGVGWALVVDAITGPDDAGRHTLDGHEPAGRSADEGDRLRLALSGAADELTALAAQTSASVGDEVGAIFEAQSLFARDPAIVEPAFAAVAAGAAADAAIMSASEAQADQLAALGDDYFRERAADIRDVGRRVAALVRGERRLDLWHPDGRPAVLVATDLDPSTVAGLRRELVVGIALSGGAPTGHTAIVSKALGIPLVLGLGAALRSVPSDAQVAVDGSNGRLLVQPRDEDVASLLAGTTPVDSTTLHSLETHGIVIAANVASPMETEAAVRAGAEAIGLVRTELLFLGRHAPPTVNEQRATYARIIGAADGRPVVFRTLDVGGDKPAAWWPGDSESNPALGVRGIRLGQRVPELLRDQLRALVEAVGGDELRVMLPMVATREELDEARSHLDAVVASVVGETGTQPRSIRLGVMIEVPSAAIMADALTEAADFISIGSNDLVQYTLAADRTNEDLADLASPLQPAVLRLIDTVVRAAEARDLGVAVCGEAAADASVIPLLIGLGVGELSVTPSAVPSVREVVSALDPASCRSLAREALRARTLRDVRELLA
jgi:dihydroxyacetone kinase phosphoprotein-dependent L subunit